MNEEDLITGGSELDDEERLRLEAELAASRAEEERLSGIINPEGDSSSTTPQQPQQVQPQPQEIESQVPTEQEQRDPAQAVPTSPFRNPDGTIDYNKIEQYGFEGDVDFLAGLADFGLGALDLIPGVDAPKIPKFQNEYAQMVRDVTSIVIPTMFLGQAGAATLKSKAQGIKFLNDPFVKFLGNTSFQAGVGAFVDRVAPSNETDDNLTGTLKQSWPGVFGWLPDSLATVNGDSPDVKLRKNIVEGVVLGVGLDSLMGLAAKQRAVTQTQEALSFVPENETAKAWFDRNIQIDATPEDVVTRSAAKRSDALDELGEFNVSQKTVELEDPNTGQTIPIIDESKPIFGYHDDYGYAESGIRSVDDYGIVGASLDQARIARNADTIYGRVGSVFTDAAIKFINKNGREGEVLIRGQAEILKDAGEYGYKVSDGRYLSHADVVAEGNKLANDFYEMDLAELRASIFPGSIYQGRNASTGTPELTDEAYAGVMGAIQKYMNDFVKMDEARARSYIGTSVAGQISDTATGMRLTSGSGSMQRAQEQILDRVEFLMAQKGMTSYVRGRSLNMLNLWNRMTVQGSQAYDNATRKRIENLIKGEKNQTLAAIDRLQLEAKETVDGLRAIKESDPEMLAPLMMAYELTDGNVKSMTSLNNYIKQSTSIWSKAFFDGQPEIPSMINQAFFASVYNNALSALATPIKAGISGAHLLIEKPIRHMAGALYAGARGDKQVIRRAMYQYSSMLDSMGRATRYMNQIFKRSATDPFVTAVRDDIGLRNQAQLDIFQGFADAKAAKGEFGPQVLMEQIQAMNDLANHPALRFGTRSMQAMDGFVQSMIADFEAKGRAFDEVTKDGSIPFDAVEADYVASKAHKEMFDENGIIRDDAVNKAAGEISLNLDNASNDALSAFIRRFPILKPFLLFTKTPLNELKLTASYNPLGLLFKRLNQYQLPFDEMPIERVKELLTERGIDVSDPFTVKGKYNELRADIMGRKAIGTVVTGFAIGMFMNDSLHGNGHYNRQVQKVRDNAGWKRRSIRMPDGTWVSYDGLGPVTNYIALVADIMDNFDVLAPNDPGELLKRASFTLAASFTDKTFLAGLEPFLDVARGDGGAINRWSSSFLTAAAIPGSSQMAEIGRLLDPGLKLINNDLEGMILNRTPLKGTLNKNYDWIDGGEVNMPDNWFARIQNTYTPWKTSGSISPEKQFLIDVEYDAYATLRTNGRGEKLTNEEQSDLLNTIGQNQLFKRRIQRIMQDVDGKEFRQRFKEAQGKGLRPDTDSFESVHMRLDDALNDAIGDAYIQSRHLTDIRRREELRKRTAEYLMRGQQEKAVEYQEFVRETLGITLR